MQMRPHQISLQGKLLDQHEQEPNASHAHNAVETNKSQQTTTTTGNGHPTCRGKNNGKALPKT